MMRSLQHHFVQFLPETLEPGILYISLEFVTASHLCCCGCGEEVVTPFSPVSWKMTFDGETVSLWPSIGNWNLRCRSHYVIDRGRVVTAGPWSNQQVSAECKRNKEAKADYFEMQATVPSAPVEPANRPSLPKGKSWLGTLLHRWFGRDSQS
jgi:hypothetical protein